MTSDAFSSTALSGKTIVVTGSSSGIGMEVAVQLAAVGARVLGVGRHRDRLLRTISLLAPGDHDCFQTDLATPEGLADTKDFLSKHGELFGLVHAAGSQIVKPMRSSKANDYLAMYSIHVVAAAEIMRQMATLIGRRGGGSFVLLSSASGVRGGSGIGAYAAAKAAVISLTRTGALEFASQGIRVNCLVPGVVTTPMSKNLLHRLPSTNQLAILKEHPLGFGAPANVASATTFLLSDAAAWISGSMIPVDGGFLAK